ncbi:MAG: TolC family protein [Burkholderiaceae bacterium]
MIEQQGLLPKTQALAYQRALLDATTQLQLRRQDLEVAKVELAALMNLSPRTPFTLADEPEPKLPPVPRDVEKLEEMALAQRPELREEDYRRRITLNDTKRAIASTLPGITFDAAWQYDSNRFLLNNSWVETGLRVSANLFKLASLPSVRRAGDAQLAVDDVRRLAQAMAVVSQVRVAAVRYNLARDEMSQAAESARVDLRLANYTRAAASSRVDSELELIRTEARSLLSDYQRHIAFANAQGAWGRLYNSIGLDIMPPADDADLSTIARAIRDSLNAWHRVTFDRPVARTGPLPKLSLRIEGIDDARMARSVRDGVMAALQRNRLAVVARTPAARPDWQLVVSTRVDDVRASSGKRVQWHMALLGPGGGVRERASYTSMLKRNSTDAEVRALADAALDAYAVAVSDRLADAVAGPRSVASR